MFQRSNLNQRKKLLHIGSFRTALKTVCPKNGFRNVKHVYGRLNCWFFRYMP